MLNPDEVSHVAQWVELTTRAKNQHMYIALHQGGFGLWSQPHASRLRSRDFIGTFYSFYDLRLAISDFNAKQRRAGERT